MKWIRTADNILSSKGGLYRIVKIPIDDHCVYSLFLMRPERHIAAGKDLNELQQIAERREK